MYEKLKLVSIILLIFSQLTVLAANKTERTEIVDLKKLPDDMVVKLSVSTRNSEKVNNKLLGYNILHYHSKKDKGFIRTFDPVTIRFPDGVWSNFYDWQTDRFTYHGDTGNKRSARFRNTVDTFNRLNKVGGIDGLVELNNEKKIKERNGV